MDVRKKVGSELRELRQGNSLDLVKRAAAETLPGFTVFELGSGGCLDTIAALLEGFRHLGSTEDVSKTLGQAKAKFFEDLAKARCLGDTRDWRSWIHHIECEDLDYLKSGAPCPDYSFAGSMQGSGGQRGGDLFIEQLQPILHLRPKVVRLEMGPSAQSVNDGAEVNLIKQVLGQHYTVHDKVLECWQYGDCTVRQRLFIVALRKDVFPDGEFTWPKVIYSGPTQGTEPGHYPIARDIAVEDSDVHPRYWRSDKVMSFVRIRAEEPGRILPVGRAGDLKDPNDPGPPKSPYPIHG